MTGELAENDEYKYRKCWPYLAAMNQRPIGIIGYNVILFFFFFKLEN